MKKNNKKAIATRDDKGTTKAGKVTIRASKDF